MNGSTANVSKDWALFLKEALANPRAVGAVFPSSPALARRMARMTVLEAGEDLVVELGAGTGAVTEALLARGVPARQLIAIERSPALADLLRVRFPGIQVICGDAVHLRRLLRRLGTGGARINIVSSLPLRSLPPRQVHAILKEIAGVLRAGGRWIQFTYALVGKEAPRGFEREASSLVWRNLPPARVDVFSRASVPA